MENQEIKEANRKAMPMFILLVIAGAAARWYNGICNCKIWIAWIFRKY